MARLRACVPIAALLLAAASCERERVSLGDDTLPDAGPAAAGMPAAAPPPDAATPDEPALPDAGHFEPPHGGTFERDAGGAGDRGSECGLCAPGELCTRADDATCSDAAPQVRCERIEDVCSPGGGSPVCGCDGQSYPTRCEAVALGATVRADGACPGSGPATPCAAFGGASCGPTSYCRFGLGAFCGSSGVLGTCEPRPQSCDDWGPPVCGCDRHEYANACWASMAGVSVAFLGACDGGGGGPGQGPTACNTQMGFGCDPDEYCATSGCGGGFGECRQVPAQCAPGGEPVCGCDGERYESACEAARARVSTDAFDSCGP